MDEKRRFIVLSLLCYFKNMLSTCRKKHTSLNAIGFLVSLIVYSMNNALASGIVEGIHVQMALK